MASINKVVLMGNFCANPEVLYTEGNNGSSVCRFRLAVKRKFSKQGATDYITCVAFAKTADFIGKYFMQGDCAVLEGSIQTDSYVNKNGVKVYTTDVVVEGIDFGENKAARESRRQNAGSQQGNQGGAPGNYPGSQGGNQGGNPGSYQGGAPGRYQGSQQGNSGGNPGGYQGNQQGNPGGTSGGNPGAYQGTPGNYQQEQPQGAPFGAVPGGFNFY